MRHLLQGERAGHLTSLSCSIKTTSSRSMPPPILLTAIRSILASLGMPPLEIRVEGAEKTESKSEMF